MPFTAPEKAGQPYRPSNGTEGTMFEEMFCGQCIHDEGPHGCPLAALANAFDLDDAEFPRDKWVHDENGSPKCTDFEPKE